jgi:fatty-acyl-CoA synthase
MSSLNLVDALDFWAARWPDRTAIKCGGNQYSWGWLRTRSERVAAGLSRAGLRKGDRLGILMHNRIEFIETVLGAMRAGVAVTLLNIRLTQREMCYPVKDAGLRLIVTDARLAGVLAEARSEVPELQVYSVDTTVEGLRDFDSLRERNHPSPSIRINSADVALVCYTSGTTGFPKGAMLTHSNIREGALATSIPTGLTYRDKILVSLPLAYTWGSCCYLREGLVLGATVTLIEPTSDPEVLIDVLERDQIGVWSTPPVLFERIAASPRFARADFSHLHLVVTGGPSLHLLKQWQGKGVQLVQAYGLTETAGHVTLLFPDEAERKRGSSGRPLMNVSIKVCDESGGECSIGVVGEILVRGPCVMKGYINNPAETAKVIREEWLHTGDMGVFDEEGKLTVVDRLKDMLKSGGLCIYPAEIERVLAGVRGLEDFVVIGVSDERWGEVPMIVVHGSTEVDLESLRERCEVELASYKRPRYVVRHPQGLPRTVSGKVIKKDLRLAYPVAPKEAQRLRD